MIVRTKNRGWDCTGGQIEEGENLEEGLLREIYEEGECTTSEETSEVKWVPKETALTYVTAPAMRYRFEKALNFSGKVNYASYVTRPEFKILTERFI